MLWVMLRKMGCFDNNIKAIFYKALRGMLSVLLFCYENIYIYSKEKLSHIWFLFSLA